MAGFDYDPREDEDIPTVMEPREMLEKAEATQYHGADLPDIVRAIYEVGAALVCTLDEMKNEILEAIEGQVDEDEITEIDFGPNVDRH
jgi:hypothetical protein